MSFTNSEINTVVECQYDSMGRRAYKKVTVNGSITLHQRYIYRGYLQISCIDLTHSHHPVMWLVTWDPTQSPRGLGGGLDKPRSEFAPQGRSGNGVPVSQPVATRPLAIRINGTWYTYGWDLTKNICELYSTEGRISTSYTYSPFGSVTATGSLTQPIQWSSEVRDGEMGLVYYNWRYYNAMNGRWIIKDIIGEKGGLNLYAALKNKQLWSYDKLGLYIQLFDERIHAYKSEKSNIELVGSNAIMILGLLLNHLYSGNGESVYYDLKHLNVAGSTYKKEAESFIYNGYYAIKSQNIYNKTKYIKPKRVVGKGFENYLLGDFSIKD